MALSSPIVSDTTRFNTQSLTVSGMEDGDLLNIYLDNTFYSSETIVGTSKVFSNLLSFIGTLKFSYTRGGEGTSTFSSNVIVTQAPTLSNPVYTIDNSLVNDLYVGEKLNITNIVSGATLVINLNNSTATVGTHYNISSITGGFQITFLVSGVFNFYIIKIDYINSNTTNFTVGASRPVTITPPVIICDLTQNQGGSYDIIVGHTTILRYTGTVPSGGGIRWYEKNLDNNQLSPRGSTETFEVNPATGNYGYVAKFINSVGTLSSESNVIRFNIVPDTNQTPTPSLSNNGGSSIIAILGFNGENKDVELWGKVLPSTEFVQGGTITTSNATYVFDFLNDGVYKVKSTKSGSTKSEFSNEVIVLNTGIVPPTVICDLYQNEGGTYNIVLGNSTVLHYTGSKPSGGSIIWYEKNLDTNNLSPRGNTETLEVTPNIGNYGYVAKFANSNNDKSNESNLIRFNFVTQSKTDTPVLIVNQLSINVILGSNDQIKDVELWGKISPSTSFVLINSVSTTSTQYLFTSLQEGIYKVRSTQAGLTTSDFTDEVNVFYSVDCNLSAISVIRDTIINYLYNIFFLNPDNLNVTYTLLDSNNNILQSGNLSTINTNIPNQKKGIVDFSNIIEGTGYKILLNNSNTSCSLLSSSFDFDIVSTDINVTRLSGVQVQDCKNFNIINITETILSEGLKISFQPYFSSNITNNPPYSVTITKGLDIIYQTQNVQTLNQGKLECLILPNKIPIVNSNVTILVTVSANGGNLSNVYGCVCQVDYTIISNVIQIEKSEPPILNPIDINNSYLSANCCIGSTVEFYINSLYYKTVTSSTNTAIVFLDNSLKIGDVVTAKQSCPNKLKSDFSNSITITNTDLRVLGGNIIGDSNGLKNMLKTYYVTGLSGSTPFNYYTSIEGGVIEEGLNTATIKIRLTDSTLAILTVTVTNIDEKYSVTLTKNINITQYTSMLVPPQLINYFNHTITGKGTPQSSITLYNSNSEVIFTGIIVDSRGLFTVNEVPFSDAYYTIAHLNNETSNISNVLLVKKEKCNCKKCCNKCSIDYDTI